MLMLALALIYLSECVSWRSLYHIVFEKTWGRWHWTLPGRWFGNQSGGLLLHFPLPPLGFHYLVPVWPISFAPRAACAYVSHAVGLGVRPLQTEQVFEYNNSNVHIFTDGAKMKRRRTTRAANTESDQRTTDRPSATIPSGTRRRSRSELFCRAANPLQARWLVEQMAALRNLSADQRGDFIEQLLDQSFDVEVVRQRTTKFHRAVRWILVLCNLQWLLLFFVAPLVGWHFGLLQVWFPLLAALILLNVSIQFVFFRMHRRFYPSRRADRWKHVSIMTLNVLASIRAAHTLSRHLLEGFHPLAVGNALLGEEAVRGLTRTFVIDAHYPLLPVAPDTSSLATETEAWFRTCYRQRIDRFVREQGYELDTISACPPPNDETCESYCPRCEGHFTQPTGECEACGGIPLRQWTDSRQNRAIESSTQS